MVKILYILFLTLSFLFRTGENLFAQPCSDGFSFQFYGQDICINADKSHLTGVGTDLSNETVKRFYDRVSEAPVSIISHELLAYKQSLQLDDWIFYQLIRKTTQQIFPKGSRFNDYTMFKWWLLLQTGYDALLVIREGMPFLYIRTDEQIFNVPARVYQGRNYVCLNSHDFTDKHSKKHESEELIVAPGQSGKAFSYKITRLPDFAPNAYINKQISFKQDGIRFQSSVKVNVDIPNLFINYPVVDYVYAFNIPISRGTYESLIPLLRDRVKGMGQKKGVSYLMNFTRYAFLFETDEIQFGTEKRLSPEETLLNDQSDCEDRASLFYMLVREIYNLPMVVIVYPKHVTIGVGFDRPFGATIEHKGRLYTICEPTPQKKHLKIGEIFPLLHNGRFDIAFDYQPQTVR